MNKALPSINPAESQAQLMDLTGDGTPDLVLSLRQNHLFCFSRHLLKAHHYREFRARAFETWQQVTCVY